MDDNNQPEVIMAKPRFPLPPKLPLILGGTILVFIAGFVLFQKYSPQPVSSPSPFPSPVPASTSKPTSATLSPLATTLIFSCPVDKNLCRSGERITFNKNPALGYLLPDGTKVLRIAPVNSSKKIGNALYEAFVFQNKECYLISYTLPAADQFSSKLLSPYQRLETLATTAPESLTVDGNNSKKVSLILQLQKFSLDKSNDAKSCDLSKRVPKDFGSYQSFLPQNFQ